MAHVCEAFGQRVQKSVFECTLSQADLQDLRHKLGAVVKVGEDSLRIYRLREPRIRYLWTIGQQPRFDLNDPLIV